MKKLAIILSLSFALVGGSSLLQAAPLAIAQDTVTHYRYVIDDKTIEMFDGSQLEGKTIVSYRISMLPSPSNGVIWVHDIRTDGTTQSADPIYVIDGKLVSKRKFENLRPSSIKSITIIKKGTQEIKQYQQFRGWKNGVIVVETKPEDDLADTRDKKVNIGYGESDSHDVSYAISSVKPDENEFYTSIYDYLRGKVAGVEVRPDNSIFIRGHNSMYASMDPLILLDGTEITDLSIINPYDIYSVDVLKDASAAIYGMKGANGVILITTKAGQQAKEKDSSANRKNRKPAN